MSKDKHEETEELEDVKTTFKNWHYVAIFIAVAIVIFSIIYFTSQPSSYDYNGFKFTQVSCPGGKCWQVDVVTNIGVRQLVFYNGPKELEDVPVEVDAVNRILEMTTINNSKVIITFEDGSPGEVGVAASNIARITGDRFYKIDTEGAVFGDVTCNDATENQTVIVLAQSDMTGVVEKDGCILLFANNKDDLLRVADAFSLHILRIMR